MTCPVHPAASAAIPSPLSASTTSSSAVPAHQQPTIGYDVLRAARCQVCSELAEKPHSRRLQGAANFATHLMLMLEVADADRA